MFYSISRKVLFAVNKYTIPDSSLLREQLLAEIRPYFDHSDYQLESVIIRGSASPDGASAWNETLSQRRARTLLDMLGGMRPEGLKDQVQTDVVSEDYVYLLYMMRAQADKDYRKVAEIVDRYIGRDSARLKSALKKADGGRLWSRLVKEYFPEMRAARMVLFFRRQPAPIQPTVEVVAEPEVTSDTISEVLPPLVETKLPRRELLSVKTNLLFDFAYMPGGYDRFCPIPNIAIEYYPMHGHFTYGASLDFPWWQDYREHKYFQIRNYQLEARYYLRSGDVDHVGYGNGPAFHGWYLQAYGHVGLFGICFDADRGWEGEAAGGGLGIGFVKPLGHQSRWRLEFGVQVGVLFSKYDSYQYESPMFPDLHDNRYYYKWRHWGNLFERRQHHFTWVGPTRIGVTLTYDLLYRKRTGKGARFKRWETTR